MNAGLVAIEVKRNVAAAAALPAAALPPPVVPRRLGDDLEQMQVEMAIRASTK